MSNQIFVYPYPRGVDDTLRSLRVRGSVLLAGSAVSTGEPLNWASLISGIPYNETNFVGKGTKLNVGSALVTALSASAGVITATAANNYSVGQVVTFEGCTTTLGLLLNGLSFTVASATSSQFTFTSASTGSGSGEVGFCYSGKPVQLLAKGSQNLTATITAFSASNGIVTVTAANTYHPGAQVVITSAGASGTIGYSMNGSTYTVLSATASAFTVTSTAPGSTTTGTAAGRNPPQPDQVHFWSANASGYVYQYSQAEGTLFVLTGAAAQSALTALSAGAYPAGVLGDCVKYEAVFARGL